MPAAPPDRLRLIRRLPVRPRIAAISEGLAVASPEEVPGLAVELLELAVPPGPRLFGRSAARRADEALVEVVRRWSVLDAETRRAALAIGRRRWRPGVVRALGGTEVERRGALKLIAESCDPACADVVVDLLVEGGHIAKSAEATLVRMAGRLGGVRVSAKGRDEHEYLEDAGFEPTPADRRVFESQLVRAADAHASHRRAGVLLAALLTLGPPSRSEAGPLLAWVRNRDHPAHAALLALIRRSKEPLIRARAWLWLVEEGLGGAALDRLARAETLGEHEAVLKNGHLLLHPLRAKRVAMIKVRPRVTARTGGGIDGGIGGGGEERPPAIAWPGSCAAPDAEACRKLSVAARRSLPRWLRALDMSAAPRARAMEPLLADHDPAVRLACVRAADSRMLADLCFDTDERVARSAVLARSGVGEPAARGLSAREARLLTRHPAPAVRGLGGQELERAAMADGDGLSVQSRLSARRAMRADREAFLAELHRRLTGGSADERVSCVTLVRRLGVAGELEAELLACLGAERELGEAGLPVVATAVAALGAVATPTAQLAVRRAVRHEADRVRANAVEAMARGVGAGGMSGVSGVSGGSGMSGMGGMAADPRVYASMIELKSDGHHRVRANAIRALLHVRSGGADEPGCALSARERRSAPFYEPAGTDELFLMLSDERAMHRVAGLWLVERLARRGDSGGFGWKTGQLCSCVARLAGSEADERVQGRAARCARWLIKQTQQGWRESAMGEDSREETGAVA